MNTTQLPIPTQEYKNFEPPLIIMKGMLVKPLYEDLAGKIKPISTDKENTEIVLNNSILRALGYSFAYDKFKKCDYAKLVYMNLWWDSSKGTYFVRTLNSRVYVKYLYEFQQWFCFLFCYKFKPGYDLHFLDAIIGLDREIFRNLK